MESLFDFLGVSLLCAEFFYMSILSFIILRWLQIFFWTIHTCHANCFTYCYVLTFPRSPRNLSWRIGVVIIGNGNLSKRSVSFAYQSLRYRIYFRIAYTVKYNESFLECRSRRESIKFEGNKCILEFNRKSHPFTRYPFNCLYCKVIIRCSFYRTNKIILYLHITLDIEMNPAVGSNRGVAASRENGRYWNVAQIKHATT